jgi:hypothetical protein
MKNAAHPPEIDLLLRTAEQNAEQIVGLLRIGGFEKRTPPDGRFDFHRPARIHNTVATA